MSKDSRATSRLLLVAAIWGFAFVAQSRGMAMVGTFTFNGVRFALGCAVLLPWLLRARGGPSAWKALPYGLPIGVVLFFAASLQTLGLATTSAGKAAFITCLYIVFVPLAGRLLGRRIGWNAWAGCAASLAGLALLCLKAHLDLGTGDLLVLGGAVFWTVQILMVERFSPRADPAWIAFWQFLACSVLSLAVAVPAEPDGFGSVPAAWLPILYGGVLSVGVAYTLQVVGQKDVPASRAAILLSLETVFAAFGGWLILGERLGPRELAGCALMLAGVVVSQSGSVPAERD